MNEIFEIDKVKKEFLETIGTEYTAVFSERQLEMSIYMLNDFCATLTNNSLVLLRAEPEQIMPQEQYQQQYAQQYQQPPVPQMGLPREYAQQYQQPLVQADPFQEMQQRQTERQMPIQQTRPVEPIAQPMQQVQRPTPQNIQRTVQELNSQLPKATPGEVDLSPEKPKSFAEKIREMRVGKKANRINPDDDN